MFPRGSPSVVSDNNIIERALHFQKLIGNHPELTHQPMVPKTSSGVWPEYKAKNQGQLLRAQQERKRARDKEHDWARQQVRRLREEQSGLARDLERLQKAKERWCSPLRILPKSESRTYLHRNEQLTKEFTSQDLTAPEHTLSSWQLPEYSLVRAILVELINEAVDESEEPQLRDLAETPAPQRSKPDGDGGRLHRGRFAATSAEELLEESTGELAYGVAVEYLNRQDYVRWQQESIVIQSVEAASTGHQLGRGEGDPGYGLVTGTYRQMVAERQSERSDVWLHTQFLQTGGATDPRRPATLDSDTNRLDFSSLRPVEETPLYNLSSHVVLV